MLILAGISISYTIGEDGIITKAENSKEEQRGAQVAEIIQLWNSNKDIDFKGNTGKVTAISFKEQVESLLKQNLITDKEAEIIKKHGMIKIGSRIITILDGAPKLLEGMTPIYWDSDNNEITGKDKNFDLTKYYSYSVTEKRWANAKTEDGSYWVWIPRYAYKITEGAYTENAGKIEIQFIDRYNYFITDNIDEDGYRIIEKQNDNVLKVNPNEVTYTDDVQNEYLVHPAFTSNADNGGGFGEISGIWVAKFEMSKESSEDGILWEDKIPTQDERNVLTTNAGNTGEYIRAVSKPGNYIWFELTLHTAYFNSKNYDTNKKSHLIKNSEWGAVTYLAYSEYGNNGNDVGKTLEIQGGGFNYKRNTNLSSNGNITGVYGLGSSGAEYVASIFKESFNEKNTYYEEITSVMNDEKYESTAYKTIYEKYNPEDKSTWKKGDAIFEISSKGTRLNNASHINTFGFYTWLLEDINTSTTFDKNRLPALEGRIDSQMRMLLLRGGAKEYNSKGMFVFCGDQYMRKVTSADGTNTAYNNWNAYRVCLVAD